MAADMMISGQKKAAEKRGAGAVQLSARQNAMQSNTQTFQIDGASDSENSFLIGNTVNNRFIGTKNFTNQSGVWIDAEFVEGSTMPEVSIKFGSDDYFRLIEKERYLAQYLSLGEQVVVVWKDKIYLITK